jgi:hypothetical protein
VTGEGKLSIGGGGGGSGSGGGAAEQDSFLALPSFPYQHQHQQLAVPPAAAAAAVRPQSYLEQEEGGVSGSGSGSNRPRRVHIRTARGTFASKQPIKAEPAGPVPEAEPAATTMVSGGARGRYGHGGGGGGRHHHRGSTHAVGQVGVDESLLEKYRFGTAALSKPQGRDEEKRNVHRVREYWLEHEAIRHLDKLLALKVRPCVRVWLVWLGLAWLGLVWCVLWL